MIYNYYLVDKEGRIKERYKVHESDEIIKYKGLIREPSIKMYDPVYDHYLKDWVEKTLEKDILDGLKKEKKNQLSASCEESILYGFKVEILGRDHHFSYDQEAQMNLQETMRLFENNLIESLNWTAHVGEQDVRLKVNKVVFEQIYLASVKAKLEKVSYFRDELVPLVEKARNEKELELITWDFKEENRVRINTDNTLEKRVAKVDGLEQESEAQKQYNTYMESSLMEVIDLTLMF